MSDPVAAGPVHIAGHVNAILASGVGGVLAGADTGGVWQLTPVPAAPEVITASPLSNDWANPDVLCLAAGPDGAGHAYAGCRSLSESLPIQYARMPVLYEALPGSPAAWSPIMEGAGYGSVYAVGVAIGRRLVAATSTGVWWAPIPDRPATGPAPPYSWQAAVWPGKPGTANAVGCTGMVIASGWPVVSAGSGGTIWQGSYEPGGPLIMRQVFAGVPDASRSSLAICAASQGHLYCVIARASDATLGAVVHTADGGQSWQVVPGFVHDGSQSGVLEERAGGQGWYNNCIAVSPVDPSIVLIGWQNGVFVSLDTGANYTRWSGDREHLHRDVHAVYFDPRDAKGQTVFVGSDGGVARTGDLGTTFDSAWNQQLANLQIASVPCHNGYGTMTVDPAAPSRVAAGLQDNGVAWCPGSVAWREITGGDGAGAIFTADGARLVAAPSPIDPPLPPPLPPPTGAPALFDYQGAAYRALAIPPYFHPDGSAVLTGLPDPVMEAVLRPGKAGPPVYVVGGNGPPDEPNSVFGLRWSEPDAFDARWDRLATLPAGTAIWSLVAADEANIYVGTQPPHVYRLELSAAGWTPAELARLPALNPGQPDSDAAITRMVPLADGSVLAAYNTNAYSGGATSGQILHYVPAAGTGTWTPITGPGTGLDGEPVFGLDADSWGMLYAATDDRILVAAGPGYPWQDMSTGLPRRGHLGHLRFISYPGGGIDLFLSTWGRSLWKASWRSAAPPPPGLGAGPGLSYNTLIGSLADGRLYQLGPGGLQPVGPIDPDLAQTAMRTAVELGLRTSELTAVLATAPAAASAQAADALAATSALANQLERGLATLHSVSSAPQLDQAQLLARYTLAGTAMISGAAAELTKRGAQGLPDEVAAAVRATTAAVGSHAEAMAAIEHAVSVTH